MLAPNTTESGTPEERPGHHLPGEVGIWIFILGDMAAFGLFFIVFVEERGRNAALFNASRDELDVALGAANTLLLLSGSVCVVLAMHVLRQGRLALARRWLLAAMGTGIGFAANKGLEYGHLLHDGNSPGDNHFFMYYFMFTAIHLTHLVIGVCVLLVMWRTCAKTELTYGHVRFLENGASYWHMVDLLWIVLFALLYLMG